MNFFLLHRDLQDKLPKHGVETVKKNEDVPMDTLYDKYVEEETQKNWKFWIVSFLQYCLVKYRIKAVG